MLDLKILLFEETLRMQNAPLTTVFDWKTFLDDDWRVKPVGAHLAVFDCKKLLDDPSSSRQWEKPPTTQFLMVTF